MALPSGMREFYGVASDANDVDVRIQVAGPCRGKLLKVVPASSLLVMSYSSKLKTELQNWQPAAAPAPAAAAGARAPEPGTEPGAPKRQKLQAQGGEDSSTAEGGADAAGPPPPAARKHVCISVQEEGEVEAVEACLRFMYTGELPSTLSVKQLFAVQRMADYVGIMECCSACLAALCALQPEALSVDDAVSLGYSDGVPEHLRTQQLKALCRSALLHHLGDVVAVMRDEEGLRGHMLKLPHGALLDLLRSEALRTDSEDSVVAAVSAWADANEASVAQLRQLAAELRLLQLSAAYFYHALPAAAWAGPEVLPPLSLMRVAAYAHGDAHAKDGATRVTMCEEDEQLPGAWLEARPRPPTKADSAGGGLTARHSFRFTRQQLLDNLLPSLRASIQRAGGSAAGGSAFMGGDSGFFTHGIVMGLILCTGAGERRSHAFVMAHASLPFQVQSERPGAHTVWRLRFRMTAPGAGDAAGNPSLRTDWQDAGSAGAFAVAVENLNGVMYNTFPAGKPITDIASWDELLLVDGALVVRLEAQASAHRLLPSAPAPAPPRRR